MDVDIHDVEAATSFVMVFHSSGSSLLDWFSPFLLVVLYSWIFSRNSLEFHMKISVRIV